MPIYRKPALNDVQALLDLHDLPASDLNEDAMAHFFGCGDNANPRGIVGLEVLGDVALLRSLSVAEDAAGCGCGSTLVATAEAHARGQGVNTLYLLTNTAEAYFLRLGYTAIPRAAVPEVVRKTREFSSLCPDSATVMMKVLGDAFELG